MKTPIEKAAEELWYELGSPDPKFVNYLSSADAAAIIRRVLGEGVPKRSVSEANVAFQMYDDGYNQCRRDIGLEDL